MPYLSASAVVIHYEEALYQVYAPLPLPYWPLIRDCLLFKSVKLFALTSVIYVNNNEKSAQGRRKHCMLAVVRQSRKFSPHRRPHSQGRGTAKI